MLKIDCKGLTFAEAKELRSYLSAQEGIRAVRLQLKLEGMQKRSLGYGGIPPDVWLVVECTVGTAVGGSAAVAVKALVEEASKDVYKLLRNWVVERFTTKGKPEPAVKLYGPDGRQIK